MAQPNSNHINHSTQKSTTSSAIAPITTPLAQHLSIWQFNLYDYKYRPDWLNAKYWANPENFDKYRW
nr:DUF6231 family protein [Psychrobacter sp. I-STPA6b]